MEVIVIESAATTWKLVCSSRAGSADSADRLIKRTQLLVVVRRPLPSKVRPPKFAEGHAWLDFAVQAYGPLDSAGGS